MENIIKNVSSLCPAEGHMGGYDWVGLTETSPHRDTTQSPGLPCASTCPHFHKGLGGIMQALCCWIKVAF